MLSIVVLTYNRKEILGRCINAIFQNTKTDNYELIVVNNNSTDGTTEYLNRINNPKLVVIHNPENEGVIARNKGFDIAKGEFIAQIDDDVIVKPDWDKTMISYFNSDDIGMVGQQAGLMNDKLEIDIFKSNNGYVDCITGFCMMMRNVGLKYDQQYGKFWHEELDLCIQYKAAGYKLKVLRGSVCVHDCQRKGDVDWTLHNSNLEYFRNKWKDKINILRLGGN